MPGEYHWKLSTWGKPRPFTAGLDALSEYVKAKSNGKFTITVYHGASLVTNKENLVSVSEGVIEMANYCTGFHPSKTPGVWALDLPFLPFDNLDTQRRVYESFHLRPEIRAELSDLGVRYVFTSLLPHYELMGTGKLPRNAVEFRSKSIRALGGMGAALKNLGARPVTRPASGVYGGLQNETIDAAAFPYTFTFYSYKIFEISQWFTSNLVLGAVHCPVVVSEKAYAALPPEFKKLVEEGKQVAYRDMIEAYRSRDKSNVPLFRSHGLKQIEYTLQERLRFIRRGGMPIWNDWIKANEQRGFSARTLVREILVEALSDKPPSFRSEVMQIFEAMAGRTLPENSPQQHAARSERPCLHGGQRACRRRK